MIFLTPRAVRIVQRFTRGTADDRRIVAREFVFVQQVANFHFHEFQQFFVFHHVAFVQEDDDVRNADLTGQQDVFAGLRHRAVRCRYDENRAVHLRRAGDHVLDVVGVARAVHVRIVAFVRFVFNVSRRNRNSAFAFFRSFVDLIVSYGLAAVFFCKHSGDRCG